MLEGSADMRPSVLQNRHLRRYTIFVILGALALFCDAGARHPLCGPTMGSEVLFDDGRHHGNPDTSCASLRPGAVADRFSSAHYPGPRTASNAQQADQRRLDPMSRSTTGTERSLPLLAPVILQPQPREPPPTAGTDQDYAIHNVREFVITPAGRVAFVRLEPDGRAIFVLVDDTGKDLKCRELDLKLQPLSVKPSNVKTLCASVGANRFIVVYSEVAQKPIVRAVDIASMTVQPVREFRSPPVVRRVAGFKDGSFVILADSEDGIFAFNGNGKPNWVARATHFDRPNSMPKTTDIAITDADNVAVLDSGQLCIQLFDRNGEYIRAIELGGTNGPTLHHPIRLAPDRENGFVLQGKWATPPVVRIAADGRVKDAISPKYGTAYTFVPCSGIQVDSKGRLWVSNGCDILRLGASGVVDRVLGVPPRDDMLTQVAFIDVDRDGLIYAIDRRTACVHVFDPDGEPIHTYQPRSNDILDPGWVPALTVTERGQFLYYAGRDPNNGRLRHLRFPAHEAFKRVLHLKTARCYFQASPNRFLAVDEDKAYLTRADDKVVKTIRYNADGKDLGRVHSADIAPDGTICILSGVLGRRGIESASINVYEVEGAPKFTVALPESLAGNPQVAYNGHRIVVTSGRILQIYDGNGAALGQYVLQELDEGKDDVPLPTVPFHTSNGHELLIYDGQSLTLNRYRIP